MNLADREASCRRRIGAAYDAGADAYARSAGAIYEPLGVALASAAAARPGERVIDLGSGAGAVAAALGAADVVAVDISAGQLRGSRVRRRVAADAMALPFADASFDVAAGGFWIGHFSDPVAALAEARRVLRPSGRIALSTWARPELPYRPKQAVLAALGRLAGTSRTRTGVAVEAMTDRIGSPRRLGAAVRAAGFRDVGVERRTVEVAWPGADAFLDYRLAMLDAASLLDESKRPRLRDEVVRALEEISADELTWRVGVLIATARR